MSRRVYILIRDIDSSETNVRDFRRVLTSLGVLQNIPGWSRRVGKVRCTVGSGKKGVGMGQTTE